MNSLRIILISVVMFLGITASAEKPDRIIIFNGHFFNELPAAI